MTDALAALCAFAGVAFFLLAPTAFVLRTLWRHRVGRLVATLLVSIVGIAAAGFLLSVRPHSHSLEQALLATLALWAIVLYGGLAAYGILRFAISLLKSLGQYGGG